MAKSTLDFVVIGAQKAGTTSLYEYLRRHPDVHLPRGKEVPYFSHDPMVEKGWEAYVAGMFGDADPRRLWGTVSPSYLVGGVYERDQAGDSSGRYDETTVPRRIAEVAPNARLIAILRDPVQRARSHHRMAVMDGREARPFDVAIDELLDGDALAHARAHPTETNGYVTWGEYGRLLAGYRAVFPREQLLILLFEELVARPLDALQRIYDFLGLEAFVPDNLGVRYRPGATQRRVGWLRLGEFRRSVAKNALAHAAWRRVPAGMRAGFDRSFNGIVYRLDLWNRRNDGAEPAMSSETRMRLERHFARDLGQMRTQLDVDPAWLLGGAAHGR